MPLRVAKCASLLRLVGVAWLLGQLAVGTAFGADTMRCGSRIVSVGDSETVVRRVCGDPAAEFFFPIPVAPGVGVLDAVTQWTYNEGSRRLLQVLEFRGGVLQSIDSDGYGFADRAPPRCEPLQLRDGQSAYRLLAACGEPDARRVLAVFAPDPPLLGWESVRSHRAVWREVWTYDFGPRQQVREITLENGRITDVALVGRGG